jgi:tRNA-dihydrouridine synthase
MRKHVGLYLKGIAGAAALRERLMRTERSTDAIALIDATIAALDAPPVAA